MKRIMIIVDTSRVSGRKFLVGAEKYISVRADWEVYIKSPSYLRSDQSYSLLNIPLDNLDGLLIRDAVDSDHITNINVPKVVNDTQREIIPGTSTIVTDSYEIGESAAEYFLNLGFENFAYCGFGDIAWSKKRYQGFSDYIMKHGIQSVSDFSYKYNDDLKGGYEVQEMQERMEMAQWLKSLPRPLCVFACNDDRAISVLEVCKTSGICVPEEVAVLGVDNDDLMCNLSSPSLSSIELDFERAGFSAAQHLNELINGKSGNKTIHVAGIEIIKRQSTDVLAINDEEVVAALRYIRNNFHKLILATDVVNATCLSRRELERRFKKYLKRSIKSEIERLRIEMIRNMLLKTTAPVYQIASELEFTDPVHFSRYFKNATGMTPSQMRKNFESK